MMDFIYNLYQNDNFTLYLTIALVVLVILFVIVLFLGKKDQKLEETKRLQKIEVNGFKEEKKEPEKVEVKEDTQETKEVVEEKKEEVTTPIPEPEVNVTVFEPVNSVVEEPIEETKKEEDEKPLLMSEEDKEDTFNLEDINIEQDLKELESIKEEYEDIVLPEDPKEVALPEMKPVFSSVFVNSKEDINTNNEEVVKSVVEPTENKNVNIFMEDDEDTMELPTLKGMEEKVELKEETPVLSEEENSFNFDDIAGETYDIK